MEARCGPEPLEDCLEQIDAGQEESDATHQGLALHLDQGDPPSMSDESTKNTPEVDETTDELKSLLIRVDASSEWKLTLCHVPADLPFTQLEEFFRPIIPKKLERGAKFMEVSFWTESDIQQAVKDCQSKYLMGHRVTMVFPGEAEKELVRTTTGWQTVGSDLLFDIFYFLAPFRSGKRVKRVCQSWKSLFEQAEKIMPNVLVVVPSGGRYRRPREPQKYPSSVTHLIVDTTPGGCELDDILQVNSHVKRLTFFRCRELPDSITEYVRSVSVKEVVLADSLVHLTFYCDRDLWTVAIYVPYLEVQVSECGPNESRRDAVNLRVEVALDSLNLWWPYPEEQTEWLRQSLAKLDEGTCDQISRYFWQKCFGTEIFSSVDWSHSPEIKIRGQNYRLNKRDCAVIGQYIDSLDRPGIGPPPRQGETYFFRGRTSSSQARPIWESAMKELRHCHRNVYIGRDLLTVPDLQEEGSLDEGAEEVEKDWVSSVPQSFEWKLILCHVPATMPAEDIEEFFRPVILRTLGRNVMYGGQKTVEVSFRSAEDMQRVLDQCNNRWLKGHRVSMRLPDEAQEEITETRAGWQSLPYCLVDDILKLVAPFRAGRRVKRVCQLWEKLIGETEQKLQHTVFESVDSYTVSSLPPEYPKAISKLVFLSRTWNALYVILRANSGINSFIEFRFGRGYEEIWMVYIYVPCLQLDYGTLDRNDDFEYMPVQIARQLEASFDELDLWWPYPAEQAQWLANSVKKIPKQTQERIAEFLTLADWDCPEDAEFEVINSGPSGKRVDIKYGSRTLDERDYLVIGLYITSLGLEDIAPPPYPWLSCFSRYAADHGYGLGTQEKEALLDETRLRARKAFNWANFDWTSF